MTPPGGPKGAVQSARHEVTPLSLAPSGWRKLAPLRRQFSVQSGFLFAPVIAADEAVAIAIKRTLAETWRAQGWALLELAWPRDTEGGAAPARVRWLAEFDTAIAAAKPGDTLLVDAVSVARHEQAADLIGWINQRREPMRHAQLRLLLLWPEALKDLLMGGAPDLWAMRAMSPVLKAKDARAEVSDRVDFNDSASAIVLPGDGLRAAAEAPATGLSAWLNADNSLKGSLWRAFETVDKLRLAGRPDDALRLAQGALTAAKARFSESEPASLRDLAVSHNKLGDVLRDLGRPEEARAAFAESLALSESLRRQLGDTPATLRDLSISHNRLGDVLRDLGRPDEARAAFTESLTLSESLRRQISDTPEVLRDLSISHEKLGKVLRDLVRPEEARAAFAESLTLREDLRRQLGDTPEVLRDLSISHERLGDVLRDLGRPDEARAAFTESLALREDLRRQLGDMPSVLRDLSIAHERLGDVLRDLGRADEARAAVTEGLALSESLRRQLGDTPAVLRDTSASHERLGDVLRDLGRYDEARAAFAESLTLRETLRRQLGDTPAVLRDLSISHSKLGDVLRDLQRPDEAKPHWQAALATYHSLHRQHGEALASLIAMSVPLSRLAAAGDRAAAADYETLRQRLQAAAPDHPGVRAMFGDAAADGATR